MDRLLYGRERLGHKYTYGFFNPKSNFLNRELPDGLFASAIIAICLIYLVVGLIIIY